MGQGTWTIRNSCAANRGGGTVLQQSDENVESPILWFAMKWHRFRYVRDWLGLVFYLSDCGMYNTCTILTMAMVKAPCVSVRVVEYYKRQGLYLCLSFRNMEENVECIIQSVWSWRRLLLWLSLQKLLIKNMIFRCCNLDSLCNKIS